MILRSSISGASLCVINRRLLDAGNPRSVLGKIVRQVEYSTTQYSLVPLEEGFSKYILEDFNNVYIYTNV
jgi:hypothetical protein